MRSITFLLLLGACADIGPFRSSDGEVTDGGLADATIDVDATITPDGPPAPMPQRLALDAKSPTQLVVTSAYIYWSELDAQAIARVPRSGGVVQTTDAGGTPLDLAAGGSSVYWVIGKTVKSASDAAFAGTPRTTTSQLRAMLAVSATDAYFIDDGPPPSGPGSIRRLSNAGGDATIALDNVVSPRSLAVSGTTLVWAADSMVKRAPLASPQTLASNQANVGRIVSDTTRTCWLDLVQFEIADLWCAGPGAAKRLASSQIQIFGLALTSTHLYYTVRPTSNAGYFAIIRYDFATGAKETIRAIAGRYPISLAVDGTYLYWLDSLGDATGEIWRMPLP